MSTTFTVLVTVVAAFPSASVESYRIEYDPTASVNAESSITTAEPSLVVAPSSV